MAILKLIMAGFLALGQILAPVGAWIANFGEAAFFTEWSAEDEFTTDCYIELEKEPGKDFVLLNLTDIQLDDDELYTPIADGSFALIETLVEDIKPDLITLSGDNAWGTMTYLETIKLIDSFDIPWAATTARAVSANSGQLIILQRLKTHSLSSAPKIWATATTSSTSQKTAKSFTLFI